MAGSDNIQVAIRVRQIIQKELTGGLKSHWTIRNNTICCDEPDSNGRKPIPYSFDRVFDETAITQDIFEEVCKPIVDEALAGFNGTIFAYGQSSSGKTFTMSGSRVQPGIISLAVEELFNHINSIPDREFLIRVGYLEIYNEKVSDLLSIEDTNLKLQEDSDHNIQVVGMTEEMVQSSKDVYSVVMRGNSKRHTAETKQNDRSSRSHCIIRFVIESRLVGHEDDAVKVSNLYFVDLAGSEKAGENTGERFKEGCSINKSLFVLGMVIRKLSGDSSLQHVSFRDSKLTRILQNALGGNSKTAIICTITPAHIEESDSTLKFASRAKDIKNKPTVNEVMSDAAMLKKYRKRIKLLEDQIQKRDDPTVHLEKAELERQLMEKEAAEKEQAEIISKLRAMIVISGTHANKEDEKPKGRRRMTWCPGKVQQELRSLPKISPLKEMKLRPMMPIAEVPGTETPRIETPMQEDEEDSFMLPGNLSDISSSHFAMPTNLSPNNDTINAQPAVKELFDLQDKYETLQQHLAETTSKLSLLQDYCRHNNVEKLKEEMEAARWELTELQEFTQFEREAEAEAIRELKEKLSTYADLESAHSFMEEELMKTQQERNNLRQKVETINDQLIEQNDRMEQMLIQIAQLENQDLQEVFNKERETTAKTIQELKEKLSTYGDVQSSHKFMEEELMKTQLERNNLRQKVETINDQLMEQNDKMEQMFIQLAQNDAGDSVDAADQISNLKKYYEEEITKLKEVQLQEKKENMEQLELLNKTLQKELEVMKEQNSSYQKLIEEQRVQIEESLRQKDEAQSSLLKIEGDLKAQKAKHDCDIDQFREEMLAIKAEMDREASVLQTELKEAKEEIEIYQQMLKENKSRPHTVECSQERSLKDELIMAVNCDSEVAMETDEQVHQDELVKSKYEKELSELKAVHEKEVHDLKKELLSLKQMPLSQELNELKAVYDKEVNELRRELDTLRHALDSEEKVDAKDNEQPEHQESSDGVKNESNKSMHINIESPDLGSAARRNKQVTFDFASEIEFQKEKYELKIKELTEEKDSYIEMIEALQAANKEVETTRQSVDEVFNVSRNSSDNLLSVADSSLVGVKRKCVENNDHDRKSRKSMDRDVRALLKADISMDDDDGVNDVFDVSNNDYSLISGRDSDGAESLQAELMKAKHSRRKSNVVESLQDELVNAQQNRRRSSQGEGLQDELVKAQQNRRKSIVGDSIQDELMKAQENRRRSNVGESLQDELVKAQQNRRKSNVGESLQDELVKAELFTEDGSPDFKKAMPVMNLQSELLAAKLSSEDGSPEQRRLMSGLDLQSELLAAQHSLDNGLSEPNQIMPVLDLQSEMLRAEIEGIRERHESEVEALKNEIASLKQQLDMETSRIKLDDTVLSDVTVSEEISRLRKDLEEYREQQETGTSGQETNEATNTTQDPTSLDTSSASLNTSSASLNTTNSRRSFSITQRRQSNAYSEDNQVEMVEDDHESEAITEVCVQTTFIEENKTYIQLSYERTIAETEQEMSSLAYDLKRLSEEIQKLQKENSNLRKEHKTIILERDECVQKSTELETRASELEDDKDSLAAKIEELEEHIKYGTDLLSSKNAEIKLLQESLEEQESLMESEMVKKSEEMQEYVKELEEKVVVLEAEGRAATEKLPVLEEYVKKLEEKVADLVAGETIQADKIAELNKCISDLEERIPGLGPENKCLSDRIKDGQENSNELAEKIADSNTERSADKIKELEMYVKELEEKNAGLESERNVGNEKFVKLEIYVNELEGKLTALESEKEHGIETMTDRKEYLDQLEKQVASLEAERIVRVEKNNELNNCFTKLEDNITDSEAEVKEKTDRLAELEKYAHELEAKIDALEAEKTSADIVADKKVYFGELEAKVASLEAERKIGVDLMTELNIHVTELEEKIKVSEVEGKEKTEKLAALKNYVNELEAKVATLEAEKELDAETITDRKKYVDELEEKIAGLEAERKIGIERMSELINHVTELEEKITASEAKMEEKSERLAEVEKYVNELEAKLASTEAEKEHGAETIAERKTYVSELEEKVASFEAEKKVGVERMTELYNYVNEMEEKVSALEAEGKERADRLAEMDEMESAKVNALESEIEIFKEKEVTLNQMCGDYEEKIATLEDDLKESNCQVDELTQANADLKGLFDSSQERIRMLEENLKEHCERAEKMIEEKENLQAAIKDLEKIHQHNDSYAATIQELREEISLQQEQIDSLKIKLDDAETEVKSLRSTTEENNFLKERVDTLKNERALCTELISEYETEVSELRRKLEDNKNQESESTLEQKNLETKLKTAECERDEIQQERDSLKEEKVKLTTQRVEMETKIYTLEESKKSLEERVVALTEQVESLEEDKVQLEAGLHPQAVRFHSQPENVEWEKKWKEFVFEEKKKRLVVRSQVRSLMAQVEEERRNAKIAKDLALRDLYHTETESSLYKGLDKRRQEAENEARQLGDELEKEQKKALKLQARLEELEVQTGKVPCPGESSSNASTNSETDLHRKLKAIEREKHQITRERDSLKTKKEELETKLQALEASKKSLEETVQTASKKLQAKDNEINTKSGKGSVVPACDDSHHCKFKTEFHLLQLEMNQLRQAVAVKEKQIQETEEDCDNRVKKMKNEMRRLQSNLDDTFSQAPVKAPLFQEPAPMPQETPSSKSGVRSADNSLTYGSSTNGGIIDHFKVVMMQAEIKALKIDLNKQKRKLDKFDEIEKENIYLKKELNETKRKPEKSKETSTSVPEAVREPLSTVGINEEEPAKKRKLSWTIPDLNPRKESGLVVEGRDLQEEANNCPTQ